MSDHLRTYNPGMMGEAAALFARPWAIEPAHGSAFVESIMGVYALKQNGTEPAGEAVKEAPQTVGGVRMLAMRGPMLHRPPSWLGAHGIEHTDTLALADQIRAADADPAVQSITITADTPGGMVGGVPELAEAIAGASKPVHVHVDGMLASAGVWAAAHADQISASPSSEVGSIGIYTLRVDSTARAAQAGYKVHLISSGGIKGAGADGKVTDAMLADAQRNVAALRDEFVSTLSAGRGRDMIGRATGEMWRAKDALSIGLIDTITGAQPKDKNMDMKQFAALAAAHPSIPAAELAAICDGKTDAEIAAALDARAAASALEAAKAQAQEAVAKADKLAVDLKAEQDAHAATKAELAKALEAAGKIAAVASGAAADPGPDAKSDGMTREKFAALDPLARAKFIREHGASAILP